MNGQWTWALLHHFLVTSLYRTLSFTEVDSFALTIAEDLNFNVMAWWIEFFNEEARILEQRLSAGLDDFERLPNHLL